VSVCYHSTAVLNNILVKTLTRTTVLNRERVPSQGPVIIASNHNNYIDPAFLVPAVPRYIYFMAKEELFGIIGVGTFLRCSGVIPIKRHRVDRAALRRAETALNSGGVICMFPEGTRSKDGGMIPGQPGATFVAMRSGVPVVPVGIAGTQNIRSPFDLLKRPRVIVNIGYPFIIKDTRSIGIEKDPVGQSSQSLQSNTDRIMAAIAQLLPQEQRGVYASAVIEDAESHAAVHDSL